MSRVVVIGSGLAGCLAALAATHTDEDASVTVVSTAPDRYESVPGTVDLLGETAAGGPVARPLEAIDSLPERHPYHRCQLADAVALFDELLGDEEGLSYEGGDTSNALVATLDGGYRPTWRYPSGMASGLVSDPREMRLVGFEGLTAFDAPLAAARLDDCVPFAVEATTVELPGTYESGLELATSLDEDDELRETLAGTVRPELDVEPRVGFPAVLGLDEHEAVRERLESSLQAAVFELPIGEPSVPGLRLRERLFRALEAAGVDRLEGTVSGFEAAGDEVQTVTVESRANGTTVLAADAAVLATGGAEAGGITAFRGETIEPIFGCPVRAPSSVSAWSKPEPLGEHRFARFGVETDAALRPQTETGELVYENLYAAGSVLGGHDFVAERSREGVAVVTGYEAGERAVRQ